MKIIPLIRPTLPSLWKTYWKLRKIWKSRQLTNSGPQHQEFKKALRSFLRVPHLSLCCNGTLALQLALQASVFPGSEVITTPFTFVATANAVSWNNLQPVFCDISLDDYNIDPAKIGQCITSKTAAILPVHTFGHPCDIETIESIADFCQLPVIYDAAHCFGVEKQGRSIFSFGDASICSFHATKIFHSLEGGMVVSGNPHVIDRIDIGSNFGITKDNKGQQFVATLGTNAKINEVQAAIGLLMLDEFEKERQKRKKLTEEYIQCLKDISGLYFQKKRHNIKHNYYNFTIRIDRELFGTDRDILALILWRNGIQTRTYFSPSLDRLMYYSDARQGTKLTNAHIVSSQILALPLHSSLSLADVRKICGIIRKVRGKQ